jgi:hypothetical protein
MMIHPAIEVLFVDTTLSQGQKEKLPAEPQRDHQTQALLSASGG